MSASFRELAAKHAPRAQSRLLVAAVAVCALVNALKGVTVGPSWNMWPYWEISYRHGFIRRGLIGTLFVYMGPDLQHEQRRIIVQQLHFAAWIGLGLFIALAGLRAARGASPRKRLLVFLGTAALLLSQLLPTIGVVPGYFDVYIILGTLVGAHFAWQRRFELAALAGTIGIFVHDGSFFLWLGVMLAAAFELRHGALTGRDRWRLGWLVVPFVMQFVVLKAHDSAALAQCAAELPPGSASVTQFEMPLRDAIQSMKNNFSGAPFNFVLATLFFGWPAVTTIACATALGPNGRRFAWLENTLIALAPCSILTVAWDLSRFLVWIHVGAFLALCRAAFAAPSARGEDDADAHVKPRDRITAGVALLALTPFALGGPLVYAYFGRAYTDYWFGSRLFAELPGATISHAFVAYYNRNEEVRGFTSGKPGACKEIEARNVKLEKESCTGRFAHDGFVGAPMLLLERGHYRARIRVTPSDCEQAIGQVEVHARYRLAPEWRNGRRFDAKTMSEVTVDFDVDTEVSAMGRVRAEISGREGCFELRSVDVERLP